MAIIIRFPMTISGRNTCVTSSELQRQCLFTIYEAGKINAAPKSTFDTDMVINVMFAMFLWANFDLSGFKRLYLTVWRRD